MKTYPGERRWSFIALGFAALTLGACNSKSGENPVPGPPLPFRLLDSAEASIAIARDTVDGFFDRLTLVDMRLQLRDSASPDSLVPALYLDLLRQDVADFSEKERKKLVSVAQKAFDLCEKLFPGLYPRDLTLIKTKGNHYGPGVCYTREGSIVLEENWLGAISEEEVLQTFLHELFHVYSRYHPEKRRALYARIGFEPLSNPSLPPQLASRLLTNPDGPDIGWQIELKEGVSAIPLIFAPDPQVDKPFFSNLEFQLFECRNGQVMTDPKGLSTLGIWAIDSLYSRITGNTDYIIHPDEILADNFAFLAGKEEFPEWIEGMSPEGQKLLDDLLQALR